jgi:hypothetical protein
MHRDTENFETYISEAGEVRSEELNCLAEFIYPETALGPCLRNSTGISAWFHLDEGFGKSYMAFYGCFCKEAQHACREDPMNSEQKFESILEKSAHMLLHMAV